MSRTQDIVFDVAGQRLVWDCPEGRPTNATAQVFRLGTGDDGSPEAAISGSVEIDLVSTTVDDDSGQGEADPRRLFVAATTNMAVGRSVLVTSADGAREWAEIVEIDSTVSVRVRFPLANTYASGDTVVGTRLTVPLSSSWIASTSKLTGGADPLPGFRVRWKYTVASVHYVHDCSFDLVRYAGGHTLTAVDVDREYPGIQGMGPGFHRTDGYRALLDQAYQRVRWDLVNVELDDNAVMDQDALDRATLLAFGVLVAKSRSLQGGDLRVLELAERDYGLFMTQVFRVGQKVPIATASGGAGWRASSTSILEK